jgi:hypothetical protein
MPDDRSGDPVYERARKRVEELQGFYVHLGMYLAVNLGLFLVNMLSNPSSRWFLWPLIGWGIAVLIHGVAVAFGGTYGRRWQERKIRQFMERERMRGGPRPPMPQAP